MLTFRLLMCLAGLATYLIVKQLVATPLSPTARNETSGPVQVSAVTEVFSNQPPSALTARAPTIARKDRPTFEGRLKADARLK